MSLDLSAQTESEEKATSTFFSGIFLICNGVIFHTQKHSCSLDEQNHAPSPQMIFLIICNWSRDLWG